MYSILIKNAQVVDGSGKKSFQGDVAIEHDTIVQVAPRIEAQAETIIDAQGLVVAPGFIDIQNHTDSYWQLFDNPQLESLVTQGFTSILLGNCGASLAPLLSHQALLSMQKWHNLTGSNINWTSFAEYAEELSRRTFACNIGSLVGYGTMRRGLLGDAIRPLEKNETEILKNALAESLEAGAFGMSSGLSYAHEIIISELELFELIKTVKEHDAMLAVHLRSEGSEIIESLEEAIDLANHTEANLKISHLKIRGPSNWHKLQDVLESLETAYHKGTSVHFDVYPYDTIWQPLYSYLPKWAIEGGRQVLLRHLENTAQRQKIVSYLHTIDVRLQDLVIASTTNALSMAGKKMGQIAKNMNITSEEAVLKLIENGGAEVLVFDTSLDYTQVEQLYTHPLAMIASDGAGFSGEGPDHMQFRNRLVHPRCFGAVPKFLKEIQNTGRLSLEEAIHKLTMLPAQKVGFAKRGELKAGNYADVVIFDPQAITDKATITAPFQVSRGIEYVFVNGVPVVTKSQSSGKLPGRFLRKAR